MEGECFRVPDGALDKKKRCITNRKIREDQRLQMERVDGNEGDLPLEFTLALVEDVPRHQVSSTHLDLRNHK